MADLGPAGIDKPDVGSIAILFPATGVQLTRFLSYEYAQSFLWTSDSWQFTVDVRELSDADRAAIQPGVACTVTVDDLTQSQGYVDDIVIRASASGGSIMTVSGRDWLSPTVDCHIDPKVRFSEQQTLLDLLKAVFTPFGVTTFVTDNSANRNLITGRIYGTKTSKKGKDLKSVRLHDTKPYPAEGAFAFASRVAQRFGLWIWPGVDAQTIVVGQPDYLQNALYTLSHKTDAAGGSNNVLTSDVRHSRQEQPTIILASGFGAGGEFAKAQWKSAIINPLINAEGQLRQIQSAYPEIKFFLTPQVPALNSQTSGFSDSGAPIGTVAFPMNDPNARPLFLYDPESHSQEQLNAFLRREMSVRMRKALTCVYEIEGHKIGGVPIAIDTIVDVDDDVSGLHLPMWILSRSFSKASGSGTRTRLEAILPGTLQF